MDLNRYTNKAQEALIKAQSLAAEYGHSALEPLHMLIALIGQQDGVVPEVIAKIGARPQTVQTELEQMLADRPRTYGSNAQPNLSRAALDVFTKAEKRSQHHT